MPKLKEARLKSYTFSKGRKKLHATVRPSKFLQQQQQQQQGKNADSHPCTSAPVSETSLPPEFDLDSHSSTAFLISGEVKEKSTTYAACKEKELDSWEEISFISSFYSKFEDLKELGCDMCGQEMESVVHCEQCGPFSVTCEKCCVYQHKDKPFHMPFIIYKDYTTSLVDLIRTLYEPHTLRCPTRFSRVLNVISCSGDLFDITIHFCDCHNQFETLLRLNLWAATPKKPCTAISIPLLNQFVAMQLEGKISFTSFCDGLAWKSGFYNRELKACLNRFSKTECVDQFRCFKRAQINLKEFCPTYNGFSKCCACPQKDGSIHYSFDACFGLVKKRAASKSIKATIRSADMFIPDETVESFMAGYEEVSKDKECSNFQAGSHLRSIGKSKKLSVTGLFGASCRHEFPQMFLNMRHGERLGYIVLLLKRIIDENAGKNLNMHITYDIACVLKRHLKKKDATHLLEAFKFGIPVFHSYGHKGDCQVENSIRRLEGFGLMDGELMERLWSYLRLFSKVSKEMTDAHRTDMLTDALHHFGAIKMENIAYSLSYLKKKADETLVTCNTELDNLAIGLPVPLNNGVLKAWKNEEDQAISFRNQKITLETDWKMTYFELLRTYRKERSLALHSPLMSDVAKHTKKANTLNAKLKSVERTKKISRWSKDCQTFKDENQRYLRRKMEDARKQLYSQATERMYLLNLKYKHADGSSIANRLSSQINKVCKNIENLVATYNSYGGEFVDHSEIDYRTALDLSSEIYQEIMGIEVRSTPGVPDAIKRKAVSLYCRRMRALEEQKLVESEIVNCVSYWSNEVATLKAYIDSCEGGILLLLQKVYGRISNHVKNLHTLFSLDYVEDDCASNDYSSDSDIEDE